MIFDLHNDILTVLPASEMAGKLDEYAAEGLSAVVAAVWTSGSGQRAAETVTRLTAPFNGVKSPCRVLFAIEDLHFSSSERGNLLDLSEEGLTARVPLCYCGLTWNGDNALAGGAEGTGRLTTLGRSVTELLSRRGIAVDTAHLNEASFWEVLDACPGRVLCSHTCCGGVFRHRRNLTDAQIQAIVARGGVVGLTLVPAFLCGGRASVDDVVRHVDYYASKFGTDSLAVGTDFYGTDHYPEGLKSYGDFFTLKYRLFKMGYKREIIDGIFYRNAADFIDKTGK